MLPENCQDALSEIRYVVGDNPLPDTMVLITKDPSTRYHVRKLVELEFPSLAVLSENELTATR